jgi:hypothetical protein
MPALPKFARSPASINSGSSSTLSRATSGAASIAITLGTLTSTVVRQRKLIFCKDLPSMHTPPAELPGLKIQTRGTPLSVTERRATLPAT